MRYLYLVIVIFCLFIGCKKSDGNSAPVIKFKKVNSPYFRSNPNNTLPTLTIEVTDADGDFGFTPGKDSSYIYIKSISYLPNKMDSFALPSNLTGANIINTKVQVDIDLTNNGGAGRGALGFSSRPLPKTDTLYFEVYMKDFKKNKSNVIRTDDPLLFVF